MNFNFKFKGKGFSRILPFLEDEELEELVSKIEQSADGRYEGISIIEVLPFVSEELADRLFLKAVELNQNFTAFGPFVSEEVLDELVDRYIKHETTINIGSLLPFMDEDSIGKLLKAVAADSSYSISETSILPFADDDWVDEAFLERVKSGKSFSAWMPFVSDDVIHELVDRYVKGEYNDLEIDFDNIYQFLDADDVRKLFRYRMAHDEAGE